MPKKNMRLSKETTKKFQHRTSNNLEDLINEVKNKENEGNMVRVNFEVSEELRNEFKAITARQGKKVKNVLADLMSEYIKSR